MTLNHSFSAKNHTRGLTLIEVTLVISLLLGLLSITFLGADAFKRGSNRAICILQVTDMQKAMRSYCNLHELFPGDNVSDLKERLIGPGSFLEHHPKCPSGGEYTFTEEVVPAIGESFMECSIPQHEPVKNYYW